MIDRILDRIALAIGFIAVCYLLSLIPDAIVRSQIAADQAKTQGALNDVSP